MMKQLYELNWKIRCLDFEFIRTEWRIFQSLQDARAHGTRTQNQLNGDVSPEERAWDGYYFQFHSARPVDTIDGCRISLTHLEAG